MYLKEDEEIVNSKCNHWKLLNKKNPKKLWELIDWSDSTQKKEQTIPSNVIENYFRGIFQAQFLTCNPTIHDALNIIENYEQQCEVTEKDVDMEELKRAVPKMKSGLGIDSISPKVMSVVPNPLLEIILKLFNGVFGNYQPAAWNSQLPMSFPEKGHTFRNPSMRGIGIGPLLSRLFDVILNNRFRCWYKPNIEQAGFREKQGCLLQIFAILLTIDMSKQIGKDVLIGIVDYEKAFDYTNRYLLTKTLTDNGIGKRFLKTFANSYETTDYIIKTSPNTIGNSISTDHGVTQGKTTSDYFSCFISDMGSSLVNSSHTNDFMDPFSLLQLADDTTVTADNLQSFTTKMDLIARYSQEKYLKIHPSKSKYLHITDHAPMSVDIVINEGLTLKPLEDLGYNWLGFWLCQSNVIPDIINFHFNKKIIHVSTFYACLDVNRDTPIKIKIVVLYNCLFASLLYSCEVWGEIGDKLAEKVLKIEKKALKSCLGVKISTPDDVIYSELNKADILSTITDRQYKFFNKSISPRYK